MPLIYFNNSIAFERTGSISPPDFGEAGETERLLRWPAQEAFKNMDLNP